MTGKAARFNADQEIQAILAEINTDDPLLTLLFAKYSREKAGTLKSQAFDREALGKRGLNYEQLDQLTGEVLLGVR